ncbi:hypothetical protein KKF91_16040 [Myxococcota bacterium]|nr:hypothetical protein [Myxococcota bacterium]MBU1432053.1 hypothetical protein [Myxococcota bacterium]MBU1897209.1 hypothetical protein [Myxococcota bacterium]
MKVTVIGGGLAGSMAAARLAASGRCQVTLYPGRPGSTALHSGGWYFGFERLKGEGALARAEAAFACLKRGLAELEIEAGPFRLYDEDGFQQKVDAAARTHRGALSEATPVLCLRGRGRDFARATGRPRLEVNWPPSDDQDRSSAFLARQLDRPEARGPLLEAIKASPLRGQGLLCPPILGVQAAAQVHAALEEAAGGPVVEALADTPSAPGLRLTRALSRWVIRAGVQISATPFFEVGQRDIASRFDEVFQADAVILATGGYLGGGLTSQRPVREAVFDLDLTPQPDDPIRAAGARGAGPLFEVGVFVDEALRPCDPSGRAHHPRLYAVGDVIGGPGPLGASARSGRAILTAYAVSEALLA